MSVAFACDRLECVIRVALLLLVCCLLGAFVACGGDDKKSPIGEGPAENVDGVWEGSYTSSTGPTGTFCIDFDQDNRVLGGTIAFDGTPSTQISGAIAEDRMVFNWGQLAAASATSDLPTTISGSGTFSGNVAAGTFDGSYSVTVTADHGTWSGHRSDQRSCG